MGACVVVVVGRKELPKELKENVYISKKKFDIQLYLVVVGVPLNKFASPVPVCDNRLDKPPNALEVLEVVALEIIVSFIKTCIFKKILHLRLCRQLFHAFGGSRLCAGKH